MIKGHQIRCMLFDLGSTLWTSIDKAAWLSIEQTSNLNAVKALLSFTSDKELSSMESHTLGILLRKAVEKRIRFEERQNDYFEYDYMAISADLGIRKPNPDIFMYALNRLSVPPEEAAMVGDSLKADIVGARMLNMLAIWKPKASLREEAKVAWMSSYIASREHQTQSSIAQYRGAVSDAELLEASEDEGKAGFTEDYLLAYVRNRDGQKLHQLQDDIKPDIIIENLKDLLEIF